MIKTEHGANFIFCFDSEQKQEDGYKGNFNIPLTFKKKNCYF